MSFLQVPCARGWSETEYRLGKSGVHTVEVELEINEEKYNWPIVLKSVGEQDVPFATDPFVRQTAVYIMDSFINDFRWNKEVFNIGPMSLTSID